MCAFKEWDVNPRPAGPNNPGVTDALLEVSGVGRSVPAMPLDDTTLAREQTANIRLDLKYHGSAVRREEILMVGVSGIQLEHIAI